MSQPPVGIATPSAHRSYQQRWAGRLLAAGRGSCAQVVLELSGPLDVKRLRAACHALSARHEILQSANAGIWTVCDLTLLSPGARARSIERSADACGAHTPRASYVLPLRFVLLCSSAGRHDLVLTCSALVADAGTLRPCCRELLDEYHRVPSREAGLPYSQVVAWQEALLQDDDGQTGRRYWATRQARAFEAGRLPFERDAPSAAGDGVHRSVRLDVSGSELSGRGPAFWLTCWQMLLHRLSNGAPFGTGFVASARRYADLEDVVGPLDRVLPVPPPVHGRDSVARSVGAMDQLLRDHVAWQEYYVDGFGSGEPEAAGASPWHVGFAYVRWPGASASGELHERTARPSVESTGAPLALVVHEHADVGPHVRLHYDPRAFVRRDVRAVGRCLLTLASDAAARPSAPLDTLSLLTAAERTEIVTAWNATAREWSEFPATSLLASLERQAAATPDAVAVWVEESGWTYASLHAQANQIAGRLQRLGVGPESRVGVWVPRSAALVAALLGVMKAGAAYVPLDPDYPPARLAFQVSDAQVAVVLTTSGCRPMVPAGPYAVEVLDASDAEWRQEAPAPPRASVSPEQLAYVIYTSGSTGQPKGAMNTHRGIANRIAWMQATYALGPSDRVLQKTSSSFDVSVWELFWPLAAGATLVLAKPGGQNDPSYIAATIVRAQVTVMHFVPAMLEAFVAAGGLSACASVRLIVSSGEALSGALAARSRAVWPGRLDNLYGPTEAAVDVTWHSCTAVTATDRPVPIGRPIANTQVYVLDPSGQPAPVGIVGELYLGGVQVGRGYWGRPDLTAQRFVPDPFARVPGARLYRTGDLARYDADGVIEYVGRADRQVKLHGNRIELGEIEAALQQQHDVRQAAVLLREDEPGVRRLVAYVVPTSTAAGVRTDSLQRQLRSQLPEYMVPAVIVPVAALPLTPNGKVDRRSLPAPSGERPMLTAPYVPPRSEVEATLARIWAEVLRVDRVGVDDNFFALGGDSILSLQVVARLMQAGWRLAPRLVFEHPTVAALARVAQLAAGPRADQAPLVGPVPLMPMQRWFFSHALPAPHHYNQAVRVELAAAVPVVDAAWLALQRHHDALRFRYTRTAEGWTQAATGPETAAHVSTIDLRAMDATGLPRVEERIAGAVQANLDLTCGPVARGVVLLADQREPHALLVIHHLVVDGVSWRILLADFELASHQLHDGRAVALPPKTTSVREWADGLRLLAASEALAAELPFWVDASAAAAALPYDRNGGASTVRGSRIEEVTVSREDTAALLHDLPARGTAHVLEVVLASLVQALAGWTGESTWRIDLEGHGREALPGDLLDAARTVGWFTSLYPVRLTAAATPVDTLRAVRTTLGRVPQSGLGFGVLRYFGGSSAAALAEAKPAEILVNYLGQADQVLAPAGALRPVGGPIGPMRDPDAPREYLLEVNAIVVGGQLRVGWTFGPRFEPATVRAVADRFVDLLHALVVGALSERADDDTGPFAFHDVALDEDELRRIAQLLEAADLA